MGRRMGKGRNGKRRNWENVGLRREIGRRRKGRKA